MKIYTIRNTELNYSNRPFYFESDEEAKQYVLNVLCSDSDRALSNLRDVLRLDCIGSIDFTSGCITDTSVYSVCMLSEIWAFVPSERVPRDSLKLNSDIKELSEKLSNSQLRVDKLLDSLKSHFKFLRKENI